MKLCVSLIQSSTYLKQQNLYESFIQIKHTRQNKLFTFHEDFKSTANSIELPHIVL